MQTFAVLKLWCLQGPLHRRKRLHGDVRPRDLPAPPEEVIEEEVNWLPPIPMPVKSDAELDVGEAKATKITTPKAAAKRRAAQRAQGQAVPRQARMSVCVCVGGGFYVSPCRIWGANLAHPFLPEQTRGGGGGTSANVSDIKVAHQEPVVQLGGRVRASNEDASSASSGEGGQRGSRTGDSAAHRRIRAQDQAHRPAATHRPLEKAAATRRCGVRCDGYETQQGKSCLNSRNRCSSA